VAQTILSAFLIPGHAGTIAYVTAIATVRFDRFALSDYGVREDAQ